MANYVLLNDALVKRKNAYISCQDRGFRFGDGVFTTIALIEKTPIFWELHHKRLELGLHTLGIKQDISNLAQEVSLLIAKNNVKNGLLRIIITRGEGSKGYLPTNQTTPNIYIEIDSTNPAILGEKNINPYRLILSKWLKPPPNCLPNNTKIMQGLNPTLAKMEAINASCDEALMLNVDGFISEASSSNIFWLENTQLCTSPLSTGCLNGIIRQKIMQAFEVEQKLITLGELLAQANTVFLTNCSAGIIPVSNINSQQLFINKNAIKLYQMYLSTEINKEISTFLIK